MGKGLDLITATAVIINVAMIGGIIIKREKSLEKNYPKANMLKINSDQDINKKYETILHDKNKNQNYLVKYDSTGNLNLIPYEVEKPRIIEK